MKKGKILFLSLVIILITNTIAFATEVPLTGNQAFNCNVTFNIKDTTGIAFTDNVTVTFIDISAGKTYDYVLTYANSYGSGRSPVFTVQANTTYLIDLSFQNEDIYSIVNSDKSEIDNFAATENGHTFNWEIMLKGEEEEEVRQTTTIDINTGNNDADKIFSNFIVKTRHIEEDSHWDGFLNIFTVYAKNRADMFEKYTGLDKDKWLQMTPYEQFLWYELYIRQCEYLNAGMHSYYFGSERSFLSQNIHSTYTSIKRYGEDEAEAFKEIMLFQFEYIKENGTPFNFMTGLNYLDVNPDEFPVDPDSEEIKAQKQNEKDMELLRKDLKGEKGIWGDTISALKGNSISILLLIILSGALIGVIVYRKRKNIDADTEE